MGRRLVVSLVVVVALIVAAVIAGGAYTALKSPLETKPNSNLTPENCSPGPCTNLQGYTIWISSIHIGGDLRSARPLLSGDQLDAAVHPPLVARPGRVLLSARHHDLAFLICSASSGRLVMTVVTLGSAMKRLSADSSSTGHTHAGRL